MSLKDLLSPKDWIVEENKFELDQLNFYETLFTLGNGYLGTRGSLEEGAKGELTGTFIAGMFDDFDSKVNEIANMPDWLPFNVLVNGERLNVNSCEILDYYRALDIKKGILYRMTRFKDRHGHQTKYESVRFVSFKNNHICCMRALVTPENYSGKITIESGIDGDRYNILEKSHRNTADVKHEFELPEIKWESFGKSRHIGTLNATIENDVCYLEGTTRGTKKTMGYACKTNFKDIDILESSSRIDYENVKNIYTFDAKEGQAYQIDKTVCIYTSRDVEKDKVKETAINVLNEENKKGFDELLSESENIWKEKWENSDVQIKGDEEAQKALRFNIYELLITAYEKDERVSIGAKTLSGQGYKGHVFWDTEIFILPFYIYTQPETAKALTKYRYHTLEKAKENAKNHNCIGSQYPWESTDTGEEVTPRWSADVWEGYYTGDEEIHVTSAVYYGVITYYSSTGDIDFMFNNGLEILFNCSRFWVSRLEHNKEKDRYEISEVIGPDEFHEHINNSVYTNRMAKWCIDQSMKLYDQFKETHKDQLDEVCNKLNLTADEVASWKNYSDKIYILFDSSSKLIEQFEGYFNLKDVPITEFTEYGVPIWPEGVDDFNSRETQLIKQADVILLLYIIPDEFDAETKKVNYEYYEKRTMHKSSLSANTYSIMGIEVGNTDKALQYFMTSARVDLFNNQRNTHWGIHAASTGGTWQSAVFGFGGFRVKDGKMTFKPWLPPKWESISYKLQWKGDTVFVSIYQSEAKLKLVSEDKSKTEEIIFNGKPHNLECDKEITIKY